MENVTQRERGYRTGKLMADLILLHSLNKYLLHISDVLGTLLGTRKTPVSKTDIIPALRSLGSTKGRLTEAGGSR